MLTLTADGEATGGDRLTTNAETIVIAVVPDVTVPGTPPASGTGGAGGGVGAGGGGGSF